MQSLEMYIFQFTLSTYLIQLKLNYKQFIFRMGFGWVTCLRQRGSEETGLLVSRRFSAILKLPDFLHANLEDFQLSSYEDFLTFLFISNLLIFPNVRESITLVILCLPHRCKYRLVRSENIPRV
jgi:hypothetical protein